MSADQEPTVSGVVIPIEAWQPVADRAAQLARHLEPLRRMLLALAPREYAKALRAVYAAAELPHPWEREDDPVPDSPNFEPRTPGDLAARGYVRQRRREPWGHDEATGSGAEGQQPEGNPE